MKVALVTPWSTDDPKSWSGVIAPMRRALEARVDVTVVETNVVTHSYIDRGLAKVLGATSSAVYPASLGLASCIKRARFVEDQIRDSGAEVVLGLAASQDLAFARLASPVVQITDATFSSITDYYPGYSGLHELAKFQGRIIERRSQRNSLAFAVATEWARLAVLDDGNLSSDAVTVAPFGPAIVPVSDQGAARGSVLRVLLVSSDWHRKGGDRAVEVVRLLRSKFGDQVTLTVVGDAPELPVWVNLRGKVPRSEMPEVFAQHDVLLELATANAGGVTLTDVHAFGLPSIATNTGGVSSIVDDGRTGLLVDAGRPVEGACEALKILLDRARWEELRSGALDRHHRLLNWDVWADSVVDVCQKVLSESRG